MKDGTLWKALALGQEAGAELAAFLRAGLRLQTPLFAQTLQTREPVFIDFCDEAVQQIRHPKDFKTGACIPVILKGNVVAVLTVGCKVRKCWSERGAEGHPYRFTGLLGRYSDSTVTFMPSILAHADMAIPVK